jgi:hypothetical protein
LGEVVNVRKAWALAMAAAIGGAAQAQPTFQPVREKILPAEPILIVRLYRQRRFC